MAELRRLFVPPEAFAGGGVHLDAERLRHLRTVLRLRAGDEFVATDGRGLECRLRLATLGRETGAATVLERGTPQRESPLRTVLAQAVPRGDRFALVLEKAVELGVTAVVPVLSGRTVPAGAGAGGGQAASRWRRIVEGALAQSGRTRLPELRPAVRWPELVGDAELPPLRLLLWERAESGLGALLASEPAPPAVLLAAGPEGGWSSGETALALAAGFRAVRLGPRILRSETAGLAALAVVQQRWGDLG